MKKIFILITIIFSCICYQANEIDTIDMVKLEGFLSKLYIEIKCPTNPNLKKDRNFEGATCIHSLTYDYENSERILFSYTTYIKNNKYLVGFERMDKDDREASLFKVLAHLGSYTGVTPMFKGTDIYAGKIQTTPMTHAYNNAILKKNRVIHDYVKDHAVVGVRVMVGDVSMHVAYLDSKRKMHYKEGNRVSVLDFKKND
jgi:hypothetical protein